ncbi:ThuA domain-containing protein [Streptomyces sp. NPDC088560]|uniref:ThuA domain-containing protein n=1 Tax=Streptomyces sp. NPDC088560 TaxID=3365868 RepID=UPI0038092B91
MRYRTVAAAASAVGVLLLSACGGGHASDSAAKAGRNVAATKPGQERANGNGLAALGDEDNQAPNGSQTTGSFNVIAFYNGDYDAAHIDFDHEANEWFPQAGSHNGFTYTATTDWSKLNSNNLANYQVVMFLDDYPHSPAQQSAFQKYVSDGGGFIGFHASAFNTDPNDWSWYHNTFLGTGAFQSNSWGPTSETLKIEDSGHAATANLPATIKSSVSEWYSWQKDLRQNPDIDILASMDQSTFPIGTDGNQTWRSGYYPIVWSNRHYKMVYNNFGHNGMNYAANTRTSSTFASDQQNQLLLQEIKWAADRSGGATPPSSGATPSSSGATPFASAAGTLHGFGGKCVDVQAANAGNGTTVQLFDCNGTDAQKWTMSGDGTLKALGKCLDVTGAGTVNGTKVQLFDCNGSGSQVWRLGPNGSLVNPQSGKCLDATGFSSADNTPLQIWSCRATDNQNWVLHA